MAHFKQFAFKKLGYFDFHLDIAAKLLENNLKGFIKVAFIKAGGQTIIDFKEYHLKKDAFFLSIPISIIGLMKSAVAPYFIITGIFIVLPFMIKKWLATVFYFTMRMKCRWC